MIVKIVTAENGRRQETFFGQVKRFDFEYMDGSILNNSIEGPLQILLQNHKDKDGLFRELKLYTMDFTDGMVVQIFCNAPTYLMSDSGKTIQIIN